MTLGASPRLSTKSKSGAWVPWVRWEGEDGEGEGDVARCEVRRTWQRRPLAEQGMQDLPHTTKPLALVVVDWRRLATHCIGHTAHDLSTRAPSTVTSER